MISVCYRIVCVYLLYSFGQGETFLPTKTSKLWKDKPKYCFQSLTVENPDEFLARIFTPYWKLTYNEQLDKKQNYSKDIVDMIMKRSMRIETPIYKLFQIVPSPVTKAYRNRDEFKIRQGVDGNQKTVGLPVGNLTFRSIFTIPPTKIVTIKESHKRVAQVYQDFIRLSPIYASHYISHGHWRTLHVRSNEEGDIMASVIVQPKGFANKS